MPVVSEVPVVLPDVPVELPLRLRFERDLLVVVLFWSVELLFWSIVVLDCPVCDALEPELYEPDVALPCEVVGAVGSLALPVDAPDVAEGVLDGTVDCDCANAPVANIVQSASEPIPSTFSVEPMCIPLRGAIPLAFGWHSPGFGCRSHSGFRDAKESRVDCINGSSLGIYSVGRRKFLKRRKLLATA